jgi:uncharacterized membrane protein
VRYEVIIRKTYGQTKDSMRKYCPLGKEPVSIPELQKGYALRVERSGIYTGFNKTILNRICSEYEFNIYIVHTPGSFILKDFTVLETSKQISDDIKAMVLDAIFIQNSETIEENYQYGFKQLSEVAVKALSPGVNDRGTAILSLRAIFRLLEFRVRHFPQTVIMEKDKKARIFTKELPFEILFAETLLPIWYYGRKDSMIKQELYLQLTQLQDIAPHATVKYLLREVEQVK